MDLNRFLTNVGATKKVINKNSDHVMLSTLSTLDQYYDEGQGILGDLSGFSGKLQDATTYVEQAIIERNKKREKISDAEASAEDLRQEQELKMEQAMDKVFEAEGNLSAAVEEYQEARTQYDDAEYDLSYWEGQGMQTINNLNNGIAALQSGAASLGIEISTEKYETLVDKLEEFSNHTTIDWIND